MSIGVVCNFYREPNALPGFFRPAEEMFDELVFVSSPPDGGSDEESCELVKSAGHRLIHDTVSQGFGALRTRCISYSKCDWVVIMDADERVWAAPPKLFCTGEGKFPDVSTLSLHISKSGAVDQRGLLNRLIARADSEGRLAIRLSRRHWLDAPGDWARPCQGWDSEPDWQLRCVKNSPFICYDPDVRMHEKIIFTPSWSEPSYLSGDKSDGPFLDHYSPYYKAMEPEQNTEDAMIYDKLEPGASSGMWLHHFPKV